MMVMVIMMINDNDDFFKQGKHRQQTFPPVMASDKFNYTLVVV